MFSIVHPVFICIFALTKYLDIMAYTKEQLFDFSVTRLIDIILAQQEQLMQSDIDSKMLSKIRKILDGPDTTNEGARSNTSIVLTDSATSNYSGKKRGRPRLSPEESARKYEEQKARQKERYHEMMAEIKGYREAQEAPKEAE